MRSLVAIVSCYISTIFLCHTSINNWTRILVKVPPPAPPPPQTSSIASFNMPSFLSRFDLQVGSIFLTIPDCFNCVIHHCQSLWKSTDTDHSFLLSYAKHCRTHNLQRTTCWGWRWFICTRLVLVGTQSCWVVVLGNNNPCGEFTDGCHTRSAMLERWRLAYE